MNGVRIAVFGLARSGAAIAKAADKRGAIVTVCDEKPIAELSSELVAELHNLNISISPSFDKEWSTSNADLIVTSPGVSKFHPKLRTAFKDGIQVISEVEFAYRIARAPIVAITGTNGKSTTTVMTYLCLRQLGRDAVLCGNIYGSGYPEIPLTEAADTSTSDQILVAEISSFQLEWIDTFKPRAATITNIADDHLNRYEGFADYAATKRRIFENMGSGDAAVWRQGLDSTRPPMNSGLQILTWGDSDSNARVEENRMVVGEESIELALLPFSEPHNYENAMAATLLAHGALGDADSKTGILDGLRLFRGLEHRMERLGSKAGVSFINNSMCTNPAAVVASSLSVRGRQHLLIGGVDKDMDFSPLAKYLAGADHQAYVYGSSAIEINRQLGGNWSVYTTLREAFDEAVRAAREGETVMLAPGAASMDQFKDFRDRGEAFRFMAKEWLKT